MWQLGMLPSNILFQPKWLVITFRCSVTGHLRMLFEVAKDR